MKDRTSKDYSPWADRDRPTADSVTDDQIEELLARLHNAELVTGAMSSRPPWRRTSATAREDIQEGMLYTLCRDCLLCKARRTSACHRCRYWAASVAETWTQEQPDAGVRTETRLRDIARMCTRLYTMSWGENDPELRAREELPWLLSLVRSLLKHQKAQEAENRRLEKLVGKNATRDRSVAVENTRLRAANAELRKRFGLI